MRIRSATIGDAAALLAIYRPYVEETAVSFEWVAPTEAEFAGRIAQTLQRYPYLTLEEAGEVRGYAYAGPFKNRAAYDWAVETTVYVRREDHGKGYGRALYTALEEKLRQMGIQNLYACISFTDHEDERLTNASRRFHERMGFHLCGAFRQCGYKFNRWYDMIWMEKMIGGHADHPARIRK